MMKVVLYEPEIPFNTGSIGRTCVALDLELILIKPYGFSLDDKTVARSGTRYWQFVKLSEYDSWDDFIETRKPDHDALFLFEEDAERSFYEPRYPDDAYLIFGKESSGLPKDLREQMQDRMFHVPMRNDRVKSLNLSNVATAVVYQALRGTYV